MEELKENNERLGLVENIEHVEHQHPVRAAMQTQPKNAAECIMADACCHPGL